MMKTLTISGFAQDPNLISENLDIPSTSLDYQKISPSKIEELLKEFTNFDVVHAWSLGTLIAINYAHILKPKKLVLYAPIYQYLESADFPHGITKQEFNLFQQKLAEDEQEWFNYFCLLIAKGSPEFRARAKKLRSFDVKDLKYKKEWLTYLAMTQANLDNIKNIETEIYHGLNDHIVSPKQSEYIKQQVTGTTLNLLKNKGHTCFARDL